jgi:hypothetical protein
VIVGHVQDDITRFVEASGVIMNPGRRQPSPHRSTLPRQLAGGAGSTPRPRDPAVQA